MCEQFTVGKKVTVELGDISIIRNIVVLEYCDTANLDIRTASNVIVYVINAAFVIYLTSWYCKMADNEMELYDMSEEHGDESLSEDYIL